MAQSTGADLSWVEEIDRELEEQLTASDMPPMSELVSEANEIRRIEENHDEVKSRLENKGVRTPTQESFTFKAMSPTKRTTATSDSTKKQSERDADDYQESFTSQQETAEIRQEIASLDTKLSQLSDLMESILKERAALPGHISNLQIEVNKQLTLMSDKINHALERSISSTDIAETKKGIEVLTGESDHVLSQIQSELSLPPSQDSAISRRDPITKSRRRVKVVE